MASIVIKDLPESTELDRQAMHAIAGGARFRASGGVPRPVLRKIRLYDPAPGARRAGTSPPVR